ncbi:hypothetical protein [Parasphingorhabdus halotolerans]|uniref:Transmembrane protein n=1 Tax=Parasphingorhabdus halotolerans TaxID=2725558 RepID=A0A6H2DNX6_9SPHN|nr:hypothetical protein [Parasphingorhabdus halotolerans]QJB70090.1 hypothetical protein HF685_12995 [Parasphingorhabdus halotolerans]
MTAPSISPLRLNLLRVAYAIIGFGLALTLWPQLIEPVQDWPLKSGVVASMLGAMSLLALLGLWRPLMMLPILIFEVMWKTIWLLRMALPLWLGDRMDEDTMMTVFECLLVIPVALLIPWDYVWNRYVRRDPVAARNDL